MSVVEYDALLVLSFGGPEGPDDVMPFLRNVTRGRDVPEARLAAVASHYLEFGGVSPINAANRALVAALREVVDVPVYWGNRNWRPFVADAVASMAGDGVRRAACFATSAYGGYSACRQYQEDIARSGAGFEIVKLRPFYDHPGFIEPFVSSAAAALSSLPDAVLVFSAHSVPLAQPGAARYAEQVRVASQLVVDRLGGGRRWDVVWQSRSGPPTQPWLAPDVGDQLGVLASEGVREAVIVPIGFVADHLEVVYDLDHVALGTAASLGLRTARAETPGVDPRFVAMVPALMAEAPVPCPAGCCLPPS